MADLNALLDRVRLNGAKLARLSGVSRAALNSWKAADPNAAHRRELSPAALRKLATGLRKHAQEVEAEANELEAAAKQMERGV
jgi:hypothetical protein